MPHFVIFNISLNSKYLEFNEEKAEHKSEILEEQMNIQKQEMEEKLKRLETIMLQKFADNYPQNAI